MTAYFFNGLGVYQIIFSTLELNENVKIIRLDCIMADNNNSIEFFAKKLSLNIDLKSSPLKEKLAVSNLGIAFNPKGRKLKVAQP